MLTWYNTWQTVTAHNEELIVYCCSPDTTPDRQHTMRNLLCVVAHLIQHLTDSTQWGTYCVLLLTWYNTWQTAHNEELTACCCSPDTTPDRQHTMRNLLCVVAHLIQHLTESTQWGTYCVLLLTWYNTWQTAHNEELTACCCSPDTTPDRQWQHIMRNLLRVVAHLIQHLTDSDST